MHKDISDMPVGQGQLSFLEVHCECFQLGLFSLKKPQNKIKFVKYMSIYMFQSLTGKLFDNILIFFLFYTLHLD